MYFYLEYILTQWSQAFDDRGLTFCDFPYQYDGVLKDQASYYLYDYDTIY